MVLGFKLDLEWMKKAGALTRSYLNCGHVNERAVCHECDAGLPQVAFEDVNPSARWIQTLHRTVPWAVSPPWSRIEFDAARPAMFLRKDAFHIYRLGVGRNFAGSAIILLCNMG